MAMAGDDNLYLFESSRKPWKRDSAHCQTRPEEHNLHGSVSFQRCPESCKIHTILSHPSPRRWMHAPNERRDGWPGQMIPSPVPR